MTVPPSLYGSDQGVTAVEFALAAPLFLGVLFGIFDLTYGFYSKAVLNGAVIEAARTSTIERNMGNVSQIDSRVVARLATVNAGAAKNLTFTRKAYRDFGNVGKPEPYGDSNKNGRCDDKEIFDDINRNGRWDMDAASVGPGGGSDVVVYTATTTYPRLFPVWKFLGVPENQTLSTSTVVRNQPFADQILASGKCP